MTMQEPDGFWSYRPLVFKLFEDERSICISDKLKCKHKPGEYFNLLKKYILDIIKKN
jgi:hypothetical protein